MAGMWGDRHALCRIVRLMKIFVMDDKRFNEINSPSGRSTLGQLMVFLDVAVLSRSSFGPSRGRLSSPNSRIL